LLLFVEVLHGIDLEQQVGSGGTSVARIPSEQGGGFYLRSNRAGGAGCLEVAGPLEVGEACIEVEGPPCPTHHKERLRCVEGDDLPTLVTTWRGGEAKAPRSVASNACYVAPRGFPSRAAWRVPLLQPRLQAIPEWRMLKFWTCRQL
jgi:hypothetical protein